MRQSTEIKSLETRGESNLLGESSIGSYRWVICGLLFFATSINYMDRQVLGILAPVLQKDIGWNEVEYAQIVTAFHFSYAVGMLGMGRLIDVIGVRWGYSLSIFVWSLAIMAHSMVRSVLGFGVVRSALGIGEAGNFPAAVKAVSQWFAKREHSLAIGIFNSGSNVGAILAPLTVPWLNSRFGWQGAFLALGLLGFIWILAWLFAYRGEPVTEKIAEKSPVQAVGFKKRMIQWVNLLRYRQSWAYVVGMGLSSPIWWFYLFWLPKFLVSQFNLNIQNFGVPLAMVYTMACVGSVGGGWLPNFLLNRGWSLNASRKTAMLVCALCVLPVMGTTLAPNAWLASFLIGMATMAHQGWAANVFALASDLFPQHAVASVVGLGGMFGSLGAVAFAEGTGFILEIWPNGYWLLFLVSGTIYLISLVIIHLLIPKMDSVREKL
ncbi:MAG: MFS transporter [Thermoguttaceae bacterium]